jgi:hypothetical protein
MRHSMTGVDGYGIQFRKVAGLDVKVHGDHCQATIANCLLDVNVSVICHARRLSPQTS